MLNDRKCTRVPFRRNITKRILYSLLTLSHSPSPNISHCIIFSFVRASISIIFYVFDKNRWYGIFVTVKFSGTINFIYSWICAWDTHNFLYNCRIPSVFQSRLIYRLKSLNPYRGNFFWWIKKLRIKSTLFSWAQTLTHTHAHTCEILLYHFVCCIIVHSPSHWLSPLISPLAISLPPMNVVLGYGCEV